MVSCAHKNKRKIRDANLDGLERIYEIQVINIATGDTILLQYTNNSARYTKAYRKK